MDEWRQWSLAPAYDLAFSSGPGGQQSTMVMGEGIDSGPEHLLKLGLDAKPAKARITQIIETPGQAVVPIGSTRIGRCQLPYRRGARGELLGGRKSLLTIVMLLQLEHLSPLVRFTGDGYDYSLSPGGIVHLDEMKNAVIECVLILSFSAWHSSIPKTGVACNECSNESIFLLAKLQGYQVKNDERISGEESLSPVEYWKCYWNNSENHECRLEVHQSNYRDRGFQQGLIFLMSQLMMIKICLNPLKKRPISLER